MTTRLRLAFLLQMMAVSLMIFAPGASAWPETPGGSCQGEGSFDCTDCLGSGSNKHVDALVCEDGEWVVTSQQGGGSWNPGSDCEALLDACFEWMELR